MCSSTASENKSRFHIKLLADRSVVLVNARGYESEIFLPELHRGRIRLRNVIGSRQPKSPPGELSAQSSSSDHRCPRIRNFKLTTATAGLAPNSGNTRRLRFELKLISNGKVVLVECNGYESEIFLPHICSRCVAMKRVSANELAQCASARSNRNQCTQKSPSDSAASLVTQAVGLSSLLAAPPKAENVLNKQKGGQRVQKSQQVNKMKKPLKDKSSTRQKRKRCKQYSKETREVSN